MSDAVAPLARGKRRQREFNSRSTSASGEIASAETAAQTNIPAITIEARNTAIGATHGR